MLPLPFLLLIPCCYYTNLRHICALKGGIYNQYLEDYHLMKLLTASHFFYFLHSQLPSIHPDVFKLNIILRIFIIIFCFIQWKFFSMKKSLTEALLFISSAVSVYILFDENYYKMKSLTCIKRNSMMMTFCRLLVKWDEKLKCQRKIKEFSLMEITFGEVDVECRHKSYFCSSC